MNIMTKRKVFQESKRLIMINEIKKKLVKDKYLYFMLLPFIAWYIVFAYLPMYGLQIAFKDYNLLQGMKFSPWVGLDNFIKFFTGPYFIRTLSNTLIINLYRLVFGFPIPIILALLFNEVRSKWFKSISQTMVFIPHFISAVVVVGIVANFLSPSYGIINLIIERCGGAKIYFLSKPEYFRTIYTGMHIWKESGFSAIVFIAAISGIDIQLYEAAVLDGANKWKQLLNVTLPSILPTIVIMLILKIGSLLEVGYESIILLYQPATYKTADVISTYVYRAGLLQGEYSLATAVGMFNGVIGLILVLTANRISNRITQIGLW